MKRSWISALVLALMLPTLSAATAKGYMLPRPILVTAYRQVGWGDSVQIGYVDENGGLWFLEGDDYDLAWPYTGAEQIAFIASAKGFSSLGSLSSEDLSALSSLAASVEDQGSARTSAANDAGTETSYAVQYSSGTAKTVLLGMSGDDRFENTDAAAQALYLFLRRSFPHVRSYFGTSAIMGPVGFQPVSLLDFCGCAGLDLKKLNVTRTDVDCEASTSPVPLSRNEADALAARIRQSHVTGKHSALLTTGGSTIYTFYDASGKAVASIEFDRDFLVMRDGLYTVTQGKP